MNEIIGKITLIVGPMFAGKSDKLIDLASEFKSVEAFKPSSHTRDGEKIKSRTGKELDCKLLDDMTHVKKSKAEATIIDEYQFIKTEELEYILDYFEKEKKTLILAGLRKKDLSEHWLNYKIAKEKSNIVIKLKAFCELCKSPAKYTYENPQGSKRAIERKSRLGTVREPRCKDCYTL